MIIYIILLIVLSFVCSSYIFIYYKEYRNKWSALDKIPGPRGIPIIGNVLNLKPDPKELLEGMYKISQQYDGIFKMKLGPMGWFVFVSDPKYFEQIMLSSVHTTKGSWYELIKDWLGTGLATSSGPMWRDARRLIQPVFNNKIMEGFTKKFDKRNKEFVEELKELVGRPMDIVGLISRSTFLNLFRNLIGDNIQEAEIERYIKSGHRASVIVSGRMFSIKIFNFIFKLSKDWSDLKKAKADINDIIINIMKKKRLDRIKSIPNDKKTFLDLLLDIQEENPTLLDEDLMYQLDTFMFAGHDTVATSIDFSVYELSCNKDIQEKIYQESIDIFGEEPSVELTMKQLDSAEYLDMFCKEVLRKYPGGPMIARTIMDPLNLGGVDIPMGCTVSMLIYCMQRTPKYYPDPLKFDPERFTSENKAQRSEYAFAAFSHGPRDCIGQRFALLELKSTVTTLVRNFIISKGDPNFELMLGQAATIIPVNGISVQLDNRH